MRDYHDMEAQGFRFFLYIDDPRAEVPDEFRDFRVFTQYGRRFIKVNKTVMLLPNDIPGEECLVRQGVRLTKLAHRPLISRPLAPKAKLAEL